MALFGSSSDYGIIRRAFIFVTGLPGSGKTTLVSTLKGGFGDTSKVYLESVSGNVFLPSSAKIGETNFSDSQEWFLDQYEKVLMSDPGMGPVLVDQDPRAVVLVYSRTFLSLGLITSSQYERHLMRCEEMWRRISVRPFTRLFVLLTAPEAILKNRILKRNHQQSLLAQIWEPLRENFDLFVSGIQSESSRSVFKYDSDSLGPADISAKFLNDCINRFGPKF